MFGFPTFCQRSWLWVDFLVFISGGLKGIDVCYWKGNLEQCLQFFLKKQTANMFVLLCIFSSCLPFLTGSHPVLQNYPSRARGSVSVQGDRMHRQPQPPCDLPGACGCTHYNHTPSSWRPVNQPDLTLRDQVSAACQQVKNKLWDVICSVKPHEQRKSLQNTVD